MNLIYKDKPVEKLTVEELEREYRLQHWMLSVAWYQKRYSQKYHNELLEKIKQREYTAEDYMNGICSEEDYHKSKRRVAKRMYMLEYHEDRIMICDMVIKILEAEVANIEDIIANRKPNKGGRPKKKKERYMGYNPRKNVSKNNYIGKK